MNEDIKSQGCSIPIGGFKPEQAWVVLSVERGSPASPRDFQLPVKADDARKLVGLEMGELHQRYIYPRP